DQVGRITLERDQAAVAREGGEGEEAAAVAGPLRPTPGGDAHPLRCASLPVVDEHVGLAVRVVGDEAGRIAVERDEAAGGREGGGEGEANEAAAAVALSPTGGDAHPFGRARLPVVDEHVGHAVRVGGDEVGRSAVEGDEAAVGREGGA